MLLILNKLKETKETGSTPKAFGIGPFLAFNAAYVSKFYQ